MNKSNIIIAILAISIAVILGTPTSCEREDIIDEKSYEELKDSLDSLKKRNKIMSDSLNREISKNDFLFKDLNEENSRLSSVIDSLKSIKHKIPETSVEQAEFFNNRYGVDDNIIVGDGVLISSPTSFSLVRELLEKDVLEKSNNIMGLIIENKDSQLQLLDENYVMLGHVLSNTQSELSLTNTVLLRAEENIDILKDHIKKNKRKNTLLYSIGIPSALIVGVLVGSLVKK